MNKKVTEYRIPDSKDSWRLTTDKELKQLYKDRTILSIGLIANCICIYLAFGFLTTWLESL